MSSVDLWSTLFSLSGLQTFRTTLLCHRIILPLVYLLIFGTCSVLHLRSGLGLTFLDQKLEVSERIAIYGDTLDNLVGLTVMAAIFTSTLINHQQFTRIWTKSRTVSRQFRSLGEDLDTSQKSLICCLLVGIFTPCLFGNVIFWQMASIVRLLGDVFDVQTFVERYTVKIYIPLVLIHLLYYLYNVLVFFNTTH
jgi:hypothetical protein